jgi:hypothetical protein
MGYRKAILNDQSNKKKALPVVTGRTAVGVTGIEPMTSPTRTERATKLRYTPKTFQRHRSANDSGIIGYAAEFARKVQGTWVRPSKEVSDIAHCAGLPESAPHRKRVNRISLRIAGRVRRAELGAGVARVGLPELSIQS